MGKANGFVIGNRKVGEGAPCLVIGEVGQAHDGSVGTAHAYIDAIGKAGADAVKFQTHIASAESTVREPWRVKFSKQDATRYDYWKRMEFSEGAWRELKAHAEELGLLFLSSPFSCEAVELLEGLGMEAWKIASGEVLNPLVLDAVRETGKPVILSSGMMGMEAMDEAVARLGKGRRDVAVMQCTTAYPCGAEAVGLNVMEELRTRYGGPGGGGVVGLSDHSGEIFAGLAAVTLGANLVEVHVALSKDGFGPDVGASLTPGGLGELVRGIRYTEKMLGNPVDKEEAAGGFEQMRRIFGKSVVAKRDLAAGAKLCLEDLAVKKPGDGIAASEVYNLVGRELLVGVVADDLILESDLVGESARSD